MSVHFGAFQCHSVCGRRLWTSSVHSGILHVRIANDVCHADAISRGFIVGTGETLEYIFYVASAAVALGIQVTEVNPSLVGYEPVIWLLFYVVSNLIFVFGGKWFWRFNIFLALISTALLLMFCLGSLPYTNLSRYAPLVNEPGTGPATYFKGGFKSFLTNLPLPFWWFVGVESINMAAGDVDDPKKDIPQGQISCVLTLFVTCFFVLLVSAGLPPGLYELQASTTPFNIGELFILFLVLFSPSSRSPAHPYDCCRLSAHVQHTL
jgi:ethanolamine permease